MLRDAAISIITSRLGERSDLTTLAIAEMQLIQTSLEQAPVLPWFLMKLQSGAYCTAGEEKVPVPSDFLRETEDGESCLWVQEEGGSPIPLVKNDYANVKARYPDAGMPKQYALVADYFRFGPVPDAAYKLTMLYFAADAVLSTNIENLWLKNAPELMIALTGKKLAMYIQDPGLAGVFEQDAQASYVRLHTMDVARKEAGRFRAMGED